MLLAPLVLFVVAGLVSWAAGFTPAGQARSGAATLSWLLSTAGAVIAVVAGARSVGGHPGDLRLGDLGGLGRAGLHSDGLSGLFLVIAFGVAVPVLCAAASSGGPARTRLPALVGVTLAAVELIVTADELFVLLFGWETLTVCFYLLTAYDRELPGRGRAAVAAVTFGKASGAALLVGGGLLSSAAHSMLLADWSRATGAAHDAGYALLVAGFAVKVGLVPLQLWLPPSYAAAAGPARAIMAGVAVNVGFYGMWRALHLLGAPPQWLIVVLLLLAGLTAILGIAHASVSSSLLRLIAWSSVENAGIITAGYAVALIGAAIDDPRLTAVGLVAGTAQMIAHAVAKALLFVAADRIEQLTGIHDLDRLRGVIRTMPWSGTGLVVGSLTLAGLPLTIGFASEWFTLEALMQQFRVHSLPLQLAAALTGALVALTVGVAGVTFVRLVALTGFGRPPAASLARRSESVGQRIAVTVLVLGCLGLAAFAPLQFRMIASGLQPLVGPAARQSLVSPWVLQPVYAGFSSLSPSWLWIVLPAMTALIAALTFLLSGRRRLRVRTVPAWSSGSVAADPAGYTSFGYANPMRKVLANVLMTRGQLAGIAADEDAPDSEEAAGRKTPRTVHRNRLSYRVDVVEIVEHYLYRPLWLTLLRTARLAKKLQSGRLDAYLTYMMITLVAVLAIATALS